MADYLLPIMMLISSIGYLHRYWPLRNDLNLRRYYVLFLASCLLMIGSTVLARLFGDDNQHFIIFIIASIVGIVFSVYSSRKLHRAEKAISQKDDRIP